MKPFVLCGALAAIAGPAAAEPLTAPMSDVRQVSVSYGDLDLGHAAGADVLVARIRSAAHRVCDPLRFSGRFGALESRACVRSAMNDAFDQLGAPFVTARLDAPRAGREPAIR